MGALPRGVGRGGGADLRQLGVAPAEGRVVHET